MSSLFIKIRELKESGKEEELEKLINNLDKEKLVSLVKSRLVDPQASTTLGYVFEVLSSSPVDESKRIALIETVLRESPKQNLTGQQSNALVMRMVIEVDRLTTAHWVRLTEYCLEQLQKDPPDSSSWKDLLPKLLFLLQTKTMVTHAGSDMSGPEYKSQVIHALCMTEWRPNIITMIADMFSEVPLTDPEMEQVTNKLYTGMADLEPSEVPPLVHQLLKVCGERCCLTLLMHAQQYFASRLGGVQDDLEHDSDDVISHANVVETKQSEGTVLFHILHCASLGRPTIRLMLKTLRNLSQAPELIFSGPLLLPSALLMILSVGPYRDSVLSILMSAITQALQDEEQRMQSNWVRELVPSQRKLQAVFENIINETPIERGIVLEGLVALCFEMLRVKKVGRSECIAEKAWCLASDTLLYLVNKNRDALPIIVQQLVEKFTQPRKQVSQFLRCFQDVLAAKPRQLISSVEFLSFYLVDQLMAVSGPVAEQSVLALVPLLRYSEVLCNSLVLVLRKSLNIPRIGTRQMAVTALIVMMQKLKAKRLGATLSQAMDSPTSSMSSQRYDIEVHGVKNQSVRNPEALCLELLQLLKHCFQFQPEVKIRLYQGMLELTACNPEMAPPALQFLHSHLRRLRTEDPAKKAPLRLDVTCKASIEADTAVLTEPLAHLLFAVTQVFINANVEPDKTWFQHVEKELTDIVNRLAQCNLHDFGFEDDDFVLEEGEKGARKLLQLNQVLGLYEVLIAFSVHTWAKDRKQGTSQSRRITGLFKSYSTASDYMKCLKRPANKKKADESQQQQQALQQQGRKRGRPGAVPANMAGKDQAAVGKLPPVLDLGTLHLLLSLLYNQHVEWAAEEDADHVRARVEFHCWVLRCVPGAVQNVRASNLSALMDKNSLSFHQLCEVAQVLFQHCVSNLTAMQDQHPDIAVLSLEAFKDLLAYITTSHRHLLPNFLVIMCGTEESAMGLHLLTDKLTALLQQLLERGAAEAEEDDKLPRLLVAALAQACELLDSQDKQLEKVQKLVQEVSRTMVVKDVGVVKGVVELLVSLHVRRNTIARPLSIITRHLCHLFGCIEDAELAVAHKNLALIDEAHATPVTLMVCARIKETLDSLALITQRLKCERRMLPYLVNADKDIVEQEIRAKERDLCMHMVQLLDVAVLLTSMAVGAELSEPILKLISSIYVSLTQITRHFSAFSTRATVAFKGSNFEKVVRVAGKVLAPTVAVFITHVEGKQRDKYEHLQTGKKYNANAAQKKIQREADCVAKTILAMEKFSKGVIQLSSKTKVPLKEHLNLGVSHDFRISSKEVQKALSALKEKLAEEGDDEDMSGSESVRDDDVAADEESMDED